MDVVDNQLVEVRILFATFDEEPVAKALARDIRIRFSYVCERCTLSVNNEARMQRK